MLLAGILVLNPVGLDILHAAFLSGESLSRGIWQPIVLTVAAILALVVLAEWAIRAFVIRRRARGKTAF